MSFCKQASEAFLRMDLGELMLNSLALAFDAACIEAKDYLPCPSKVTRFGDRGGSFTAGKMGEASS